MGLETGTAGPKEHECYTRSPWAPFSLLKSNQEILFDFKLHIKKITDVYFTVPYRNEPYILKEKNGLEVSSTLEKKNIAPSIFHTHKENRQISK